MNSNKDSVITEDSLSSEERPYLDVASSVSGRLWVNRATAHEVGEAGLRRLTQTLSLMPGMDASHAEPLARAMAGRGIAPEGLDHYLNPTLKALFPDPSSFIDMDRLIEVLIDAMAARKNVYVFADYDVDGATSAALLVLWFRAMGHELKVYVPDRLLEGYGPSEAAFDRLKAEGADLVITVDCGAMAHRALNHAADIGLDVVVIDHHLMREDPPRALAVVNPNRPGCSSEQGNLAAAGVVFVVLAGLNRAAEKRGLFADHTKPDILQWLDLAALGAICDVTALTGFNRALTAQGLKVMSRQENPGIRALMQVAGGDVKTAADKLSVFHSGFILGPRINAGGRVGRSDLGVRLLSTPDEAEALELARQLDELNTLRREVEAEVLEAATAMGEGQGGALLKDEVVLIAHEGWHPGVIGIVAGRLRERWRKPVIIIGLDPITGMGKGSGRSQTGVNLGAAVGAAFEAGIVLSGGGHAMAAGLSVAQDKLEALRDFLNAYVRSHSSEDERRERLEIDATLSSASANRALLQRFEMLAPFGPGNPEPMFAFGYMRVDHASLIKGAHVRCDLSDEQGHRLKGIAWRAADTKLGEVLLRPSGLVHIAGRLKPDDYMGRNGVQLEIEDICALSEKK